MDNKFKEIKDICITFIVAIIFMALASLLKVNNIIIQYFLENVMPLLIMASGVVINKPSVYLKYFTFRRKNKNIQLSFTLKYSEFLISNTDEYKKIIDRFLEKYTGDIKILRQKVGSEVCTTSFAINSVNYEINYDDIGESLTLFIASQLNYKNFFDKIEKAVETVTDIAGSSHLNFNRCFTKINIEFFEEKDKISNPFFKKIYKGFNLNSAEIKFTTKENTTVRLTNNCIGFISNGSSSQLIKDMKKTIFI